MAARRRNPWRVSKKRTENRNRIKKEREREEMGAKRRSAAVGRAGKKE